MTEIALNGFNIIPAFDSGNGIGVAQVMKSGIGAANSGSGSFEMTVHNGISQMVSQRISKNKIALFPRRSSLFLQLRLILLLLLKKKHYRRGGGDYTAFPVFGGGNAVDTALLPIALNLLVTGDCTPSEVYAVLC